MKKAFTLVELLVTISIIGILAALSLVSFTGAQKQARDTRRKSDLKQFQTALEVFAGKNGSLYPSYTAAGGTNTETLCVTLTLTDCPNDPKEDAAGDPHYNYQSDGTGSGSVDATYYVLSATLEAGNKDYWVVCSNGKVGESDSVWTLGCPL